MPLQTVEIPRNGSRRLRGVRAIIVFLATVTQQAQNPFVAGYYYTIIPSNMHCKKKETQTTCSSEESSAAADALHKRNQQHTTPSFKYEVLRNRGCLTQRLCNHTAKGITPSVDGDQLAARGPTCGGVPRDTTHTHERKASHWEPERTSASIRCSLQPER